MISWHRKKLYAISYLFSFKCFNKIQIYSRFEDAALRRFKLNGMKTLSDIVEDWSRQYVPSNEYNIERNFNTSLHGNQRSRLCKMPSTFRRVVHLGNSADITTVLVISTSCFSSIHQNR